MASAACRGAVLAGFGAFVLIGTALAQQRQPRVVELQLMPADATVRVGERQVFLPVAFDATNTPIAAATFEWSSSNPAVVSIDRDGVATGIAPGIAIITVRTGRGAAAKTAQAPVQVTAAQGAPAAAAAPVAAPVPAAQPVPNPVQPQNAAPRVATPVTPPSVPQGTAALAHQPAGTGAAEALVVRPVNAVLVPGERLQLDYRLYRTDGGAAEPQPLVFATDTGAAVPIQVDSTGLVTAGRAGRAGVRVGHPTDARLRREVAVVVGADSVRFSAPAVTLPAGVTDTLVVAVPAQNRTLALDAHVFTFSSSDSSRVAVRPFAPIVEARAPGQAVITAESPHYPVPLRVTVTVRARVTAVRGTPSDSAASLVAGQHQTFTAQALGADASPVPDAQIRWAVEDTTVARFDPATG
ncbi:MAG: Ig-like domain-containing protein, partial [Gemmatimonadota bacterium]